MNGSVKAALVLAALMTALGVSSASAQVFGTFPWQMQPYCNVITLTLTNTPAGFTLDGADDQCGATNRASAVGVATFNASGNVTINFTIVTAPAGKPVHVSAIVSPANGNGTWTDSVGNSGTFAFFGAVPGQPARPLPASGLGAGVITTTELAPGAVGGSDVNLAEVQARVTGVCPAGQSLQGINANGSVVCAVDTSGPMKRSQFGLVSVPTTANSLATSVVLSTLTFTSPVTATALLSGRGICNTFGATGQVVIGSYAPGETTPNSNSDRTFILVNLGGSNQQIPYTTERAVSVDAGVEYTFSLRANQSAGSSVTQSCSGTYSATFHQLLP